MPSVKDCPKCLAAQAAYIPGLVGENYVFATPDGRSWHFDVSLAKLIVAAFPREQTYSYVEELLPHLDEDALVREHVSHVDIAVPGLAVEVEIDGEWGGLLIDGCHRLARLRDLRREVMWLHTLDRDESLSCLVSGPGMPDTPALRRKRALLYRRLTPRVPPRHP